MVHSDAWTTTRDRSAEAKKSESLLSSVVYRSHAVEPLSALQLDELTLAAQARNRCESISGLMVYTDNCFFQWLEGPADSVDRIMQSIRNDRRHTDIEIVDSQFPPRRSFADWSMMLALSARDFAPWRPGILSPPRDILDELHRNPDAVPRILLKMGRLRAGAPVAESVLQDSANQKPLDHSTATLLKSLIISTVIPELVRQYRRLGTSQPVLAAHPRVSELANLLVEPDQQAALELIRELHQGAEWKLPLVGTLFEAAARCLGDFWNEDFCSEFDVTLGLSRLQTAVGLFASEEDYVIPVEGSRPLVLIVPEPGELHRLGATLDSRVLSIAGWGPHVEAPADDKALQEIISTSWFDVLDLSLSAAFRRDHWLPRVKETIRLARRASLNPALMVLVGGRVFVEERHALASAGADLASKTALNVDALIREKMLLLQGQ
jgi:hypothetical protein